ncbi:flavodoxin family protein [Methanobacterium formicicum]|uniref:NADPH-dependent FMN reductase n=1 Tax=Methanobacterium formicicum (strain DSM 3637 / PP1) TaxID=1204725 RepID=K2Q9Y4_METFP|nr:flavodoxin family protein [Methanobacterium formicicum]EKF84761.1 NADPH-dependent FMN reductase [Methanobacterium formicicum DSM 3637]
MRIFGFIGSPLKNKSNTYTLTKMMLDKLQDIDGNLKYDLFTAEDVNIMSCKGCWSCMSSGFCPLDERDDMGVLKKKMLESNLIIWGSPVYAMQVSGQMKTFLDRLAHWYHTLRLAGKPGVTVSTTAGSGLEEVHGYLRVVLNATGVKVVSTLDTFGTLPGTLVNHENALKSANKVAYEIYPFLTGEKPITSDKGLEETFQANKIKVTYGAEVLVADRRYWEENGILEMNSFNELLQKIKQKS